MSWAGYPYANYPYPGSLGRSTVGLPTYPSYPYLSSAPVQPTQTISVSPDSGSAVAVPGPHQEETDKTTKSTNPDRRRLCLVISVSLMASLLVICVIVLIILVVLLQTDTSTKNVPIPEDPTVGFPVTRTDLTFSSDLSDSSSQAFNDMEKVFCDMILKDWFQLRVTYDCSCAWFKAGSIQAYVHLKANEETTYITNILSDLQTIVPVASQIDPRVRTISKSDVQIVQ